MGGWVGGECLFDLPSYNSFSSSSLSLFLLGLPIPPGTTRRTSQVEEEEEEEEEEEDNHSHSRHDDLHDGKKEERREEQSIVPSPFVIDNL